MIQSMMKRKVSFLGHPEWTDTPWSGRHKPIDHRFYDIGFAYAGVLEEQEKYWFSSDPFLRFNRCNKTISRLYALETELEAVYKSMKVEHGSSLYWVDAEWAETREQAHKSGNAKAAAPNDEAEPPFEFQDIKKAALCLLYWTFHILIAFNVQSVSDEMNAMLTRAENPLDFEPIHPVNARHAIGKPWRRELVSNITRGTPFLLRFEMGTLGPTRAILPLSVCTREIRINPPEEELALRVWKLLYRLVHEKGLNLASSVTAPKRWEDSSKPPIFDCDDYQSSAGTPSSTSGATDSELGGIDFASGALKQEEAARAQGIRAPTSQPPDASEILHPRPR